MASSVASTSSLNVPFGRVLRHQSENNSENILKLKLKKPKSWNWELSTSKSSININFPRILLYDSNNKLLADVDEADFVVNGKENEPYTPVHLLSSDISRKNRLRKSCSFSVSNSSLNSARTSGIIIQSDHSNDKYSSLKSDSSLKSKNKCTRSYSISSQCTLQNDETDALTKNEIEVPSQDEEKLPEAPIYIYSAKGLIKRDFNAKEFDDIRNRQNSLDSGKNSDPLIPQENQTTSTKNNVVTITERKKTNVHLQPSTESDANPLTKCKSMAELTVNGKSRRKSRQKIRRTKSGNSSSSTKCQIRNITRNPSPPSSLSSSLCDENIVKQTNRKSVYHIQKSAAGTIIVPEEKVSHRRVRYRYRSKSSDKLDKENLSNHTSKETSRSANILKPSSMCYLTDEFPGHDKTITKTDNLISTVLLSHELNSVGKNFNECINDINEIDAASIDSENDKTYKNYNEHLVSIKTENNQPNVKNGRASSANSNNNVNNGNDRRQKKAQLNRKVSFVQFNCEKSDESCNRNSNGNNNIIHNDWIDVQLCDGSHQNEKYINSTTRANGRKKVFHGKIKKSASAASFCNNYSTSDSDDNYDTYAMPPVRHKKRRFSQRPKSSSSSYQHHGK